jgi:hypothetical protein
MSKPVATQLRTALAQWDAGQWEQARRTVEGIVNELDPKPVETIQLADCPCCGGEAEAYTVVDYGFIRHAIRCVDCNMRTSYEDNVGMAAGAWNQRVK